MTRVEWTQAALGDIDRLHTFLATSNPQAAARAVRAITRAPDILKTNPQVGRVLPQFAPREVRRLIAGHYEIRYEVAASTIYVLRVWHTREDR